VSALGNLASIVPVGTAGATATKAAANVASEAAPPVARGLLAANQALGKKVMPNAEAIREVATAKYAESAALGGVIKPTVTNNYIKSVESNLLPKMVAGKPLPVDGNLKEVADVIKGIQGSPLDLESAKNLDQYLGTMIDKEFSEGRLSDAGRKIMNTQTALRQTIEGVDESMVEGGKEGFAAYKEATKLWATSARLGDIERIIMRAEGRDNPATILKNGFQALKNNPNRMKGFSEAERKAINKAAETGIVGETLRGLGSRFIPIITAGSGGGLGAMAATTAGTMASRGLATRAQLNRATGVADAVAARSGLPAVQQPLFKNTSALERMANHLNKPQTP
jgi:hypothetical protein